MGYTHYWYIDKDQIDEQAYRRAIVEAAEIIRQSPVAIGDGRGDGDPELNEGGIRFNGKAVGTCPGCPYCNWAQDPKVRDLYGLDRLSLYDRDHDQTHEAFYMPADIREPGRTSYGMRVFDFCKTAAKRYDVVVTVVLATMQNRIPAGFDVHSDGEPEDWVAGVALARVVLDDDTIGVPAHVLTEHEDCD